MLKRRATSEEECRRGVVDAGIEHVDKIAFQANQDGLSFRIAEASIEFEHLRAARGHHDPR